MAAVNGPVGAATHRLVARTPEELEELLEDTLVRGDLVTLARLFVPQAVLASAGRGVIEEDGAIARVMIASWHSGHPYVADVQRMIRARDLALVIRSDGINVVQRSPDGTWRFSIILSCDDQCTPMATQELATKQEETFTMNSMTADLVPIAVAASEGEARWWLGGLAIIKARAAQTGGHLSIIEVTEGPGEAPLHVHHRDDESFWILDGEVTFEVGGAVIPAAPGDFLFAPRGIPHRYTVGANGCRMLFISTPGGFDDMVIAMSEPATNRTLPPSMTEEPDWELVQRVAATHGCELLA